MFLELIYSIIFGAIQGLTEFLPISSSGHLVILHQVFNLEVDNLIFDVALHFGTLLALLIFFRCKLFASPNGRARLLVPQKIIWIIIATLPAAVAGFFMEDIIGIYLRNIAAVSWALVVGGVLLIIADRYSVKQKDFNSLNPLEIFLIGTAQAIALIPGVSRSAITIIAGLGLKLQRQAAAEFSFLLAIPILFGAAAKKFFDLNLAGWSAIDVWVFIIGTLTAFIVGYLVIKYFIKFLKKYSLVWFGWYRIILGAIVLLWIYL
jgi:undecaprenyl-diphosphatase